MNLILLHIANLSPVEVRTDRDNHCPQTSTRHCSIEHCGATKQQPQRVTVQTRKRLNMANLRAAILAVAMACSNGFSTESPGLSRANTQLAGSSSSVEESRRRFLVASTTVASLAAAELIAEPCDARYILNEETGEYDEVEDKDWQTTWGDRLDKAKSMGTDDVFLAAKGGLKQSESDVPESEASKKRRALAGCRTDRFREKSGIKDTKQCTVKVLGGEYDFILDQMQ